MVTLLYTCIHFYSLFINKWLSFVLSKDKLEFLSNVSRIEAIIRNAKIRVIHVNEPHRDYQYFQRITHVPHAPILIANSEDIGTVRCRANHADASIDFFREQENLNKAGADI